MSQMNRINSLACAEKENVGVETRNSPREAFGVQIAFHKIHESHFFRQVHSEVKGQEMTQLSNVRQSHFEMA